MMRLLVAAVMTSQWAAQSAAAQRSGHSAHPVAAASAAEWQTLQKELVAAVGRRTARNTVSVAQVRMAVKSLGGRIGHSAGQGPIGVGNYIKEQLLPQAQMTKVEMQHEVDGVVQTVKDCGLLLWTAEKEVEHREHILMEDESGQYQCVGQQHQLSAVEHTKCGQLSSFTDNLAPPPAVADVNRTPADMKECITKNYNFYNENYPMYVDYKGACADATLAAEQQLAECDVEEHVIEEFYCKMKFKRDAACTAYGQCYVEKLASMQRKVRHVQDLEAHVKEEFQSMSCFGDALGDGEDSDAQVADGEVGAECDPNVYETNHLSVVYPPDPIQEKCISLMRTKRDHSAVVCDGPGVAGAGGGGSANATAAADAKPNAGDGDNASATDDAVNTSADVGADANASK